MNPTGSNTTGYLLLVSVLLLALSPRSFSQATTIESDPSVLSVLPKNYPLDRARVAAQNYPWSAIGLLSVLGGTSTCTGTLVAEQLVLTAAHCVYRLRNFPEEINFLAGYEQDRYVAHSKAKKVHVNGTFKSDKPSLRTLAHDWALIELEKPIGEKAGYLGWAYFDAAVFDEMSEDANSFKISGYRGDRRFVQTVDQQCRVVGFTADEMLILHRCPITSGDSGGPILLPYRNDLVVVGVDVGVRGKRDGLLQRGEKRNGYAVPSASFHDELTAYGVGSGPINASNSLRGRLGKPP